MKKELRFYLRGKQEVFEWWDPQEKQVTAYYEFPLGQTLMDFLYLDFWNIFGNLQAASSLDALWQLLHGLTKTHPYLIASKHDTDAMDYDAMIGWLTEQVFTLEELQKKLLLFVKTCLSIENSKSQASREARVLSFFAQCGGFETKMPRTELAFVPVAGHAHTTLAEKLVSVRTDGEISPSQAKKLHAIFTEVVYPEKAEDFISYFTVRFLQNGTRFKLCKYCGRYFAVLGSANADYCTRPYDDSGKTCRQIGAVRLYQSKKSEDPVSRLYTKAYKKYFAWIKYGKYTKEQFSKWSSQARKKRDACTAGVLPYENFRSWLNIKEPTDSKLKIAK